MPRRPPILCPHSLFTALSPMSWDRQVREALPLSDFFIGPGRTVLNRGELLESVDLLFPKVNVGAAFGRITRRRGVDLATINLCGLIDANGSARFAFGAVGPTPFVAADDSGALAASGTDMRGEERRVAQLVREGSSDHRCSRKPGIPHGDVGGDDGEDLAGGRQSIERTVEDSHLMSAERVPVRIQVNQRSVDLEVPPHHTLLDVLRDDIRLTGTKECCAEGECGACTVLVNGQAVCSCLVLAVEMDGQHITTIEGLASDGQLDPIQEAFVASRCASSAGSASRE